MDVAPELTEFSPTSKALCIPTYPMKGIFFFLRIWV
jgi:hypothetical protein